MRVRTYGGSGRTVIVVHGGPAAAGEAAPIARGLAGSFRVLEPWQRGSGEEPLTVARHVADLHELVQSWAADGRPALVGESWGAMLVLAYAATHPRTGPLVLVGCGTFDLAARAQLQATLAERMDADLRRRLAALPEEYPDPHEQLQARYELTHALYDYDALPPEPDEEVPPLDLRAHEETWQDMLRLQAEGVYPAAFSAIRAPVLMLHGAYDPHPGDLIRASLAPHLPQLEYREWKHCGHSPWRERQVRDEFFAVLRGWLAERMGRPRSASQRLRSL